MRPATTAFSAAGLLAAGGLAGAALSSTPESPAKAATAIRRPAPVEVRTQVIHRTVRVVRHVHPKHQRRRAAAPAPAAPAPAPAAAVAVRRPVVAAPSPPVAAPAVRRAPVKARPLRTRSSTTGKGGGHGDEGGGDD